MQNLLLGACWQAAHVVTLMKSCDNVQVVSEAARRLPEEVFRAEGAGAPRAEGELTREQRRARRAARKRTLRKRLAAKVNCS